MCGVGGLRGLLCSRWSTAISTISRNEDILDCRTLQRRSSHDFEVPFPIRIGRLPNALGNVQGYRLAGTQPLVARRTMDALQRRGFLVDPGYVADREPVDVQLFVPECHAVFLRFRSRAR